MKGIMFYFLEYKEGHQCGEGLLSSACSGMGNTGRGDLLGRGLLGWRETPELSVLRLG